MATKAAHLRAIIGQRVSWTQADRMQAERLAYLRFQIEKLDRELGREGFTVATAAGGSKTNPKVGARERLVKEESQLTRRLGLGLQRTTDNGRSYKVALSPGEMRERLWRVFEGDCLANLKPGMWLSWTRMQGCEIPEDATGYPNNPLTLPVPGENPGWGTEFAALGPGIVPPTLGERFPGWETALDKIEADRIARGKLAPVL
ncbi:hypothetical protein [Burkholderia cepacia]|nr:hypothetical protein [Burkholderia cepacia]